MELLKKVCWRRQGHSLWSDDCGLLTITQWDLNGVIESHHSDLSVSELETVGSVEDEKDDLETSLSYII